MSALVDTRPIVFQIGFNKCATTAMYKAFQKSGIPSLHYDGRKHRRKASNTSLDNSPQKLISENIKEGKLALDGLEKFTAFFDMELFSDGLRIENFKKYKILDEQYPNAKFILNKRDAYDWLLSRARHNDGVYLEKESERFKITYRHVIVLWARDYRRHNSEVKRYFEGREDKLLIFHVDRQGPHVLKKFLAPEFKINLKKWKHRLVTDERAEKLGWQDAYRAITFREGQDQNPQT